MLYAYRWQVELFFRCIKRTFNALHLWSHEADGIKIQFYIYLIVYVLLIHFKQTLMGVTSRARGSASGLEEGWAPCPVGPGAGRLLSPN